MKDPDSRPEGTKCVSCPHCNQEMLIYLSLSISKVERFSGAGNSDFEKRWMGELSQKEKNQLDRARKTGILDAYRYAVENSGGSMPNNVEKHLLGFFKDAKQKTIPSFALDEFKSLYPGKFIEFYATRGVGCVVASGVMEMFIPTEILTGSKIKTQTNGIEALLPADISGVRMWMHTKMGYVPSDSRIALEEFRSKKSFGEFARPML